MRTLYIFPHPDDESFGPARAIASQTRTGHEVSLLTLTRGGATKERLRLGLSVEEMGSVREQEMHSVAEVLGLSDLTVLDFPDSGLKEMDPRKLEDAVREHILALKPEIVVTYPVHGISGFHDHLVTHAVVKRVCTEERVRALRIRLAFFTLTQDQAQAGSGAHTLASSTADEIDCLMQVDSSDMERFRAALDCYVTYQQMIERTGIKESMDDSVAFEIFQENHNPPLGQLEEAMPRS